MRHWASRRPDGQAARMVAAGGGSAAIDGNWQARLVTTEAKAKLLQSVASPDCTVRCLYKETEDWLPERSDTT
jgi:hypothetical protein